MTRFEDADQIPLPPSPKNLNDLTPKPGRPSEIFNNVGLKDVIANPLYAYIRESDKRWVNFDRRNMLLQEKANWINLLAVKVTPGNAFKQTKTVRQGIVSSTSAAEMFATSVGVKAGVSTPVADLGGDISETLTQSTGMTFQFSSETEVATTFTISTGAADSVVWLWQLRRDLLLTGDLVTWAVTNSKGIRQLTGSDGRAALTRDGEGRERINQMQVRGAKREGSTRFEQGLPVDGDTFVFTAFPSADNVTVQMSDADGNPLVVPAFDGFLDAVAAEIGEGLQTEAA